MSKRLYRSIVVGNSLVLLSLGMQVCRAASLHDRGGNLQAIDWLVIGGLLLTGIAGIVALLQATELAVDGDAVAPSA